MCASSVLTCLRRTSAPFLTACGPSVSARPSSTVPKVYAAAYGKSPEFYSYQRWLDALRKSFKENSKMVLGSQVPLLDLQK